MAPGWGGAVRGRRPRLGQGLWPRAWPVLALLSLCAGMRSCTAAETDGGDFTCLGAYNPIFSEKCSFVKWKIARRADGMAEAGRRKAAEEAISSLTGDDSSSACTLAAQDFACAREFPQCPISGERAAYWPACRSMCERVRESCGTAAASELDCTALVDDRRFCTEVVADGRFHLDPLHGPYDHMVLTASLVLCLWLVVTVTWCFHTYSRPHGVTLPLQRFLSFLPFAKTVVISAGLAFWVSCADLGVCSYWISALWLNLATFFDTYLVMAFALISYGWCMTRERVSPAEWRRVVVIGLSYFFISSILALFRASSPATAHLLNGCILFALMGSFISNASLHRSALTSQTEVYRSLNMRGAVAIATMLKRRIRIFEGICVAYTVGSMVIGLLLPTLSPSTLHSLIAMEAFEIVLFALIGFLFRSDVRVVALLVALPEMHPPTEESRVEVVHVPVKEGVARSLARNKCLIGTLVSEDASDAPPYVLVQLPDDVQPDAPPVGPNEGTGAAPAWAPEPGIELVDTASGAARASADEGTWGGGDGDSDSSSDEPLRQARPWRPPRVGLGH